jgi:hypothetical protein
MDKGMVKTYENKMKGKGGKTRNKSKNLKLRLNEQLKLMHL